MICFVLVGVFWFLMDDRFQEEGGRREISDNIIVGVEERVDDCLNLEELGKV